MTYVLGSVSSFLGGAGMTVPPRFLLVGRTGTPLPCCPSASRLTFRAYGLFAFFSPPSSRTFEQGFDLCAPGGARTKVGCHPPCVGYAGSTHPPARSYDGAPRSWFPGFFYFLILCSNSISRAPPIWFF